MKKLLTKPVILFIVVVIGLSLSALPAWYFYQKYQDAKAKLVDPNVSTQQETVQLVKGVNRLIALPENEQPTVATVTDVEKLASQPFFARAQNGDKVLFYTNAKKAYLYRPSANLLIDVAPLTIGPTATDAGQAAGAKSERLTVVLRNGTSAVGLTKRYEEVLKQKAPELVVLDRENAKKQSYTKTLLVDVKGTNASQAAQLAQTLGLVVGPLPPGEATPAADFLIIVGEDKK